MARRPTGRRRPLRLAHRHLWMALAVVAPVVAFVRAMRGRWQPEGDDATIVLRSRELLNGQFPLQGMRSTAGGGDALLASHHPGPLELHILMPASILGTGWAIALTCIAVAAATSIAVVHWAHRLGGDPAVVVFGSGVLLAQFALGPEAMFRPFNPYFGLLPLYLALVLLAAHFAHLPNVGWPLVLTTGLIAQANLAYAPIGAGLAGTALAVSGWRMNRDRPPRRRRPRRRRSWRKYLRRLSRRRYSRAVTLGVLTACIVWIPVLLEPFRYDPGNLEQLLKVARSDSPSQGLAWAVGRIGMFAPPPFGFRTLGPNLVYDFAPTAQLVAVALFIALLAAAVPWGRARRRRLAVLPARTAVLGIGLILVTLASLPVEGLANHYLASLIPLVTFTWAALTWRVVLHMPSVRRHLTRLTSVRITLAASAVVMVLTLAARPPSFVGSDLGRGASELVLSAASDFPPGTHFDIGGRGYLATLSTAPAAALALELEGYTAHYLFPWPVAEDAERLARDEAPSDAVMVHLIGSDVTDRTPPPGSRFLGTVNTERAQETMDVYLEVPGGS